MSAQDIEATAGPAFPSIDRGRLVSTLGVLTGVALLLVFVAAPLITIFLKSLQNDSETFVGLDNFVRYFSSAGLILRVFSSL